MSPGVPFDATPLLRVYARQRMRHLATRDAVEAQRRQLVRLVRRARGTRFGRAHGFAEIRTIDDFRTRVPLHRYEDMWERYWRNSFPLLALNTFLKTKLATEDQTR